MTVFYGKELNNFYKATKGKKANKAKMDEKQYGHKKMVVWQMADKLDAIMQEILNKIPKNEYKLREQLDSASDSVGSNFVEGYYSGSLAEYIKFCRYSKRSIGELQQRLRRILRKRYITDEGYRNADKVAGQTMYLFDRLIDSLEKKRVNDKICKSVSHIAFIALNALFAFNSLVIKL